MSRVLVTCGPLIPRVYGAASLIIMLGILSFVGQIIINQFQFLLGFCLLWQGFILLLLVAII